MFKYAITRKPGPNFASGLTSALLGKPSYELILQQHEVYLHTLRSLELHVIVLDVLADYPDAYFVEDVAVVTKNRAVITRPGAPSRAGETAHISSALAEYRELAWIQPPGTLDGGDVMMVKNHCYIGISRRTNREGAEQLGENFRARWPAVDTGAISRRIAFKK
jgi:dimethylargininase